MKKYCSTQSKDLSFYVKFRTDQMENFTHGFLRNIACDGFNEIGSKMKVDEVYGSGKAELIQKVWNYTNQRVTNFGVKIEQFGFIGGLRLPSKTVQVLNNKIVQYKTLLVQKTVLKKFR